MKIVSNTGRDRVVDLIQPWLQQGHQVDLATDALSLYAYSELKDNLAQMGNVRIVLPPSNEELNLLGSEVDRAARNRLQSQWLASRCADWVEKKVEVRRASQHIPQGAVILRKSDGSPQQAVFGSFSFSSEGLGLAPGNPFNLIQASESPDESKLLSQWFDGQWYSLNVDEAEKIYVVELLRSPR